MDSRDTSSGNTRFENFEMKSEIRSFSPTSLVFKQSISFWQKFSHFEPTEVALAEGALVRAIKSAVMAVRRSAPH